MWFTNHAQLSGSPKTHLLFPFVILNSAALQLSQRLPSRCNRRFRVLLHSLRKDGKNPCTPESASSSFFNLLNSSLQHPFALTSGVFSHRCDFFGCHLDLHCPRAVAAETNSVCVVMKCADDLLAVTLPAFDCFDFDRFGYCLS